MRLRMRDQYVNEIEMRPLKFWYLPSQQISIQYSIELYHVGFVGVKSVGLP